ncbi:hypothetical protein G6O69_05610 [Pseudenhygromyxa sp. WMMC2535]|uniref:MYXO-CTERM sorting domain-containing protein n=1 Tax=Pseudenhygromyxa sp. WMMC2535 TaxID=2712867 RepID=UPI0015517DDE|nr:hypothetical protein [Pseudenhygromyxa sp. WMMC2535]
MDRGRRRRLGVLLGAGALGGLVACTERPLALGDSVADVYREPACALLVDTWGHWEDGTRQLIMNHEAGSSISVCMCMSEEEFDSGVRDDELADLLLDACLAYSELYGYDWDECEEKRAESEWWLWYKVWWDHEVIDFAYDGSSCEPEEEEEGCAVTRESGPGGVLALGLLLLGLRRRE